MINFDLNRVKKILLAAAYALTLIGCGGGGGGNNNGVAENVQTGAFTFSGAKSIIENADGTWTLYWTPLVGAQDIKYQIYERAGADSWDFSAPAAVTDGSKSTYITKDLKTLGNHCYIVRNVQGGRATDNNSTEICTNHEAFSFSGLNTVNPLSNGSFLLTWSTPTFGGISYQVYYSTVAGSSVYSAGDWKKLAKTGDGFYKTDILGVGEYICYNVRYESLNLPVDENTTVLCTSATASESSFSGIETALSPGPGSIDITWSPVTNGQVAYYNIYLGTKFKTKVADTKSMPNPGLESSYKIQGLANAVSYNVGVRAVSVSGREDANTKILSVTLPNFLAQVTGPVIELNVGDIFDAQGNPGTDGVDDWLSYDDIVTGNRWLDVEVKTPDTFKTGVPPNNPTAQETLLVRSSADGLWKPLGDLNDQERNAVSSSLKAEARQDLLLQDDWDIPNAQYMSPWHSFNTKRQVDIDALYDKLSLPEYEIPQGISLDDSTGTKTITVTLGETASLPEEQKNILDLTIEDWDRLSDDFRPEARVVVGEWKDAQVVVGSTDTWNETKIDEFITHISNSSNIYPDDNSEFGGYGYQVDPEVLEFRILAEATESETNADVLSLQGNLAPDPSPDPNLWSYCDWISKEAWGGNQADPTNNGIVLSTEVPYQYDNTAQPFTIDNKDYYTAFPCYEVPQVRSFLNGTATDNRLRKIYDLRLKRNGFYKTVGSLTRADKYFLDSKVGLRNYYKKQSVGADFLSIKFTRKGVGGPADPNSGVSLLDTKFTTTHEIEVRAADISPGSIFEPSEVVDAAGNVTEFLTIYVDPLADPLVPITLTAEELFTYYDLPAGGDVIWGYNDENVQIASPLFLVSRFLRSHTLKTTDKTSSSYPLVAPGSTTPTNFYEFYKLLPDFMSSNRKGSLSADNSKARIFAGTSFYVREIETYVKQSRLDDSSASLEREAYCIPSTGQVKLDDFTPNLGVCMVTANSESYSFTNYNVMIRNKSQLLIDDKWTALEDLTSAQILLEGSLNTTQGDPAEGLLIRDQNPVEDIIPDTITLTGRLELKLRKWSDRRIVDQHQPMLDQRPQKLQCEWQYEDKDTWQELSAVSQIFNKNTVTQNETAQLSEDVNLISATNGLYLASYVYHLSDSDKKVMKLTVG